MVTRIRQLLDWQQLSPTQFADYIGVGRPVVSHILSERNKPSLEVVQRIIAAFPGVSLPWLLSGTGEMLADATPPGPTPALSAAPPTLAPDIPATADTSRPPEQRVPTAQAAAAPVAPPAPVIRRASPAPGPAPARFSASRLRMPAASPPPTAVSEGQRPTPPRPAGSLPAPGPTRSRHPEPSPAVARPRRTGPNG